QPFFEMRQGLVSSWPLGMDVLGREHILHTSAVATMLPWLQEDLADADGHYWGYNQETGGLCVFDPFADQRFHNNNNPVMDRSDVRQARRGGAGADRRNYPIGDVAEHAPTGAR